MTRSMHGRLAAFIAIGSMVTLMLAGGCAQPATSSKSEGRASSGPRTLDEPAKPAMTPPDAPREPKPVAPSTSPLPPPTTPTSTKPAESSSTSAPRPADDKSGAFTEVFPGIRINREQRVLEFDGIVPIDVHNAATPTVYLEAFVCGPDSKEHESLVMTKAKPSEVHAALLALGLQPGKPGTGRIENGQLIRTAATGEPIDVVFVVAKPDGSRVSSAAVTWVKHAKTGQPLQAAQSPGWVFAGSRMVERQGRTWYDADGTGLLVGLHTFSSEMVAWREMMSPWAADDEPVWIADAANVPKAGTAVTVRLVAPKQQSK